LAYSASYTREEEEAIIPQTRYNIYEVPSSTLKEFHTCFTDLEQLQQVLGV
jgi:hypothetical protein